MALKGFQPASPTSKGASVSVRVQNPPESPFPSLRAKHNPTDRVPKGLLFLVGLLGTAWLISKVRPTSNLGSLTKQSGIGQISQFKIEPGNDERVRATIHSFLARAKQSVWFHSAVVSLLQRNHIDPSDRVAVATFLHDVVSNTIPNKPDPDGFESIISPEDLMNRWIKGGTVGLSQVPMDCFAAETPVMTAKGIFPIAKLAGSTHRLLTSDGQWVDAPVRAFGKQPLMRLSLTRRNTRKTLYVTPSHRWLLFLSGGAKRKKSVMTDHLRVGAKLQWNCAQHPNGLTVDREGAARGFVFGDGTHPRDYAKSVAYLHGDKDAALRYLFDGFGNPPVVQRPRKSGYAGSVVTISGLPLEWKTAIPALDCAPSYLYGWLAGYFAADGTVGPTGYPILSCAAHEPLARVRAICDVLGVGTYSIRSEQRLGYGKVPTPLYKLSLVRGTLSSDFFLIPKHRARYEANRNAHSALGWTVAAVEATDRVEEVYCAVVDGTHAFTLEDNILTGNCDDKTIFLAALCYHAGIPADVVLLDVDGDGQLDHAGVVMTIKGQQVFAETIVPGVKLGWAPTAKGRTEIISVP